MKLLYSGSSFCDEVTLKRLLVVAEEIQFMDRPSVTFGNWGTIGQDSFARRIDSTGSPVGISAISPPTDPLRNLYSPFLKADINNPQFAACILRGLKSSDIFASKFIQLNANYGNGLTGSDIVETLRACGNELIQDLNDEPPAGPHTFNVSIDEGKRETLKAILFDASIQVTSTLMVAEQEGTIPVSEDPFFAELIALRATDSGYVGHTPKAAPYVGLDIAKAVIPDEMLSQMQVPDILKYREKSKDAYEAWTTEINRATSSIGGMGTGVSPDEIARIVTADLIPQLTEYKNEMSAIRDDLFASLVKKVVKWEMPTISFAYLADLGFAGAITLFVSALAPAVPDTIDYFKDRRNAERRNAMAFLIGLSDKV